MEELKTIFQFINAVASLGSSPVPQRREPKGYVIRTGNLKRVRSAKVAVRAQLDVGEPLDVQLFFSFSRGGQSEHRGKGGQVGGASEADS